MSEAKLLFIYFLMGLIFGGVSAALYIVGSIKYNRIQADHLRFSFERMIALWIIIGFIILLATAVLR